MAEADTRLETLEDEVKVLKGEVKRTLVDLRALLMREDSPLGEGAAAKRMAMQDADPVVNEASGPAAVPSPISVPGPGTSGSGPGPVPEAVPGPAPQPAMPQAVPGPGPGPGPGPEAVPGPAPQAAMPQAVPGPGPEAVPGPAPQPAMPQAVPGPGPESSSQVMPYPQVVALPGVPLADNSVAVAQQERMKAEHERRMAEHDRKMAEFENGAGPLPPKNPGKPARAEPDDPEESHNDLADALEENAPDFELEEDEPEQASLPSVRKGRSRMARADLELDLEKKSHGDQGSGESEVHGEKKSDSRGKSERVTSIYDEYRELLEETKQTHTIEDEPVGPPLDVNLMANLVYWASLAKQRVGEAQLKDILHLYIQSGHSRPELEDLLVDICKMVDVESAVIEENGSDWVDLLFHLHGILTGGFPVMKIPYIRLPVQDEA